MLLRLSSTTGGGLRGKGGMLTTRYRGAAKNTCMSFNLCHLGGRAANFRATTIRGSMDMLPARACCAFAYNPIRLSLIFATPLVVSSLSLLSAPIGCVSCHIHSLSGGRRSIRVCIRAAPRLTVGRLARPAHSGIVHHGNVGCMRTKAVSRPVLTQGKSNVYVS